MFFDMIYPYTNQLLYRIRCHLGQLLSIVVEVAFGKKDGIFLIKILSTVVSTVQSDKLIVSIESINFE